jgi:hypothetical protein
MIVPRMPLELLPEVVVGVGDAVSVGVGDDELAVGDELVLGGAEVCLDFDGVGEDG